MKRLLTCLLVTVLVLSLAACGSKNGAEDLVKVGDTVINSNELDQYTELYAYIQGMDLSQITDEKSLKYIKGVMLEDMISMEAMKQHYEGKEDKVLPKTIKEDTKKFIEESKKTEGVGEYLKEKKITDETLERFYLSQFFTKAYYEEVEAGMPDLETDAKKYYDENKANFEADEVTASHILVNDEALAKEIIAKLKAGEKFEDLAQKYGTDSSKDNGGSLGTFGRGEMVKEFEDAAFALKPGEISDVVKTKFGYHVIKVTDKKQGLKTYDEVKETIKGTLVNQAAEGKIKELRESTGVKYLTDEYGASQEK